MGKHDQSTSSSDQETVTISTEDANTIKNLKDKLDSKNKEIQEMKKVSESEIQTNLPARIIKQNTFKGNFHNGYADGTVEEETKKLRATQRKARVGK